MAELTSRERTVTASGGSGCSRGDPAVADRTDTVSSAPSGRAARTARAVVLLAVAEIVGKLATLAMVVAAARGLPRADFGVFSLALAVGLLASVLPSWGFEATVVQRGSARPGELPGLLARLLAMRAAIAGPVLALACVVLMLRRDGGTALAAAGVAAAPIAETFTDAYRSVATALQRPARAAAGLVAQRIATTLAVFTVGGGLVGLALTFLAGTLLGTAALAVLVARLGVRPDWRAVDRGGLATLHSASGVAGLHSLASMALFRIDVLLLGVLAGDAAVGLYAAVYRLLETVLFVAWVVGRAVFPVMAADPSAAMLRRGMERGLAVLAAAFAPYGVVLWLRGADVLGLLYGSGFAADGVAIARWLAPAPLLFGVAYLGAYALLARDSTPRVLLVGSVGALLVNVAANLALVPRLAGTGAALATSLSYAVEALLILPAVRHVTGPMRWAAPVLPAVLGSLVVGTVLLMPVPLLPALALTLAAYPVVWYVAARRFDPEQAAVARGLLGGNRE